MENDSKTSKEIFSENYALIEAAVNHAIGETKILARILKSATDHTVSYSTERKIFGGVHGEEEKLVLSFPKDAHEVLAKYDVSVSTLEKVEKTDDFYIIPKEIYLDRKLFPKLFKLAFDMA